jgi:hypothetical protein
VSDVIVGAYEQAKAALAAEAAVIVAISPAYSDSDRVGPHGAVHLTMDALWQRPELVDAIAAYFHALASARAGR